MTRITSMTLAFGLLFVAGNASAMPLRPATELNIVVQARMVCDENGRCGERDDAAEGAVRGVLGVIEGRGRDERGEREHRRGRDRDDDRGYRRDDDD